MRQHPRSFLVMVIVTLINLCVAPERCQIEFQNSLNVQLTNNHE